MASMSGSANTESRLPPSPGTAVPPTPSTLNDPQRRLATTLPRLSTSASAATTAGGLASPPAPLRSSVHPRFSAESTQPPPSVFFTYPPAAPAASMPDLAKGSPSPLRPGPTAAASTPPPSAESMELAVVPFVGAGSNSSAREAAPLTRSPHSLHGTHPLHRSGSGLVDFDAVSAEGVGGGYFDGASAPYGELAPTTVSTERVCPHCLRPYDLYDVDDYGEMYAASEGYYRSENATPRNARQLPPPPSLPAPATPSPPQQPQPPPSPQQQPSSVYYVSSSAPAFSDTALTSKDARTSPRVVHTRAGGAAGGGHSGGSPYPPPAVAFTAHYFRALPPPAVIAAAAATGTSPLAIEYYSNPDPQDSEEQPMFAAVVAGGQGHAASLSGVSGALVPASAFATAARSPPPPSSQRRKPASPLKLMQSEEEDESEDARGQTPLPGMEKKLLLREDDLLGDEEESPREGSPTSTAYSPNAPGPAPNNGYYKHYFKELRQLGRGTYGGVYLCRHLMCGVNLGDFALKKIPVGDKAGYLQSVLREVRILEEVRRHPNVVEYKHSWVEDAQLADFGPPVRCLFILMEYASAGSLDAYLDKYGTNLSNLAVWYFFLSAVAGTAHLHQKHILHRDLKPQNLLLAESKGRPPRVLVSDFGTAALLGDISYERSGGTGTLEYMAPELFEMAASPRGIDEHYVNHHTMASDVWSLGMILYYLAFDATLPERREDGGVLLNTPRQASYGRPPEMLRLMEAMLQLDPVKRPRCADILNSSAVQSIMRTFNQDDPTQWDIAAQQQQQQQRKGPGGKKSSSPPQASGLPTRWIEAGVEERAPRRTPVSGSRHHITVTSTTAPALQTRRERQSASTDSAASDNENLLSSRVVELQSTTALVDLAASARPASGARGVAAGEETGGQPHGRGKPARRLSPMKARHEGRLPGRGSLTHRPRSPQLGSVSSPGTSPPPQLVDEGVQTDPVNIVDT